MMNYAPIFMCASARRGVRRLAAALESPLVRYSFEYHAKLPVAWLLPTRIMNNFAQALAALRRLKAEGVVTDYAIGGAMALVFWSEPIPTFDLDVFVQLPRRDTLVSLETIYEWARRNGYREEAEHIVIAGVPVQVIPAHNSLAAEAIETAVELDYEGQPVRVIRPEYLIALYLEPSARTHKRLERVAALLDEAEVDRQLLDRLLTRYNLKLPRYE